MAVNQISPLITFSAGTTAVAADVNQNFTDIRTAFNNLVTGANAIAADTIAEQTPTAGVTIDGVLLKDGAIAVGAVPEAAVTQHQTALAITAAQVTSLTFADARIAASNVTQHQAALSIGWGQLTGVPSSFTPSAHAIVGSEHTASGLTAGQVLRATGATTFAWQALVAGDIPNLDAAKVTTGTFANARISEASVTQHQAALSIATSQITGTFNASIIGSGTFADARIAASNVTQHQAALSIAETQIPNGSIFPRLASNETITGEWNFAKIFCNTTSNANNSKGLTIDQGVTDDHAITIQGTGEVSHGLTSAGFLAQSGVDCYVVARGGATGGCQIQVTGETGSATPYICRVYGGAPSTTQADDEFGGIHFLYHPHDGANALTTLAANSNVFSIGGRRSGPFNATLFILDIEGDIHVDGSGSLSTFDSYDDVGLIRAMSRAMAAPGEFIESQWDRFVEYNRETLQELRLLGPDNPKTGARGMWNVTKAQRLLFGAAWQQECKIRELQAQVDRLEDLVGRLLPAGA